MLRILIVDDEARVVNGLYEFLQESVERELEILRAYTVYEALEHAQRSKIDILLTDIKMPGMTGLELSNQIIKLWPQCKLIFLTGYDDFDYAQDAIRQGGIDYILKIEGDENVLRAVEKAIHAIEKDWANEQYLRNALKKIHLAYPSLRKELFLDIFFHRGLPEEERRRKFQELEVPLSADSPVLQVIGRIDRWPDTAKQSDRALYLFSIQNIAEEYLAKALRYISFDYDQTRFVWLLQPHDLSEEGYADATRFVNGMLESIHATFKSLLKIPVSLAFDATPSSWEELGGKFFTFFTQLNYGFQYGDESIVWNALGKEPLSAGKLRTMDKEMDIRLKLKQTERLEQALDRGDREEAKRFLLEVLDQRHWHQDPRHRHYFSLEVFCSLSAFWLDYLNRRNLTASENVKLDLNKLMRLDLFHSWEDVCGYFLQLAEQLAQSMETKQAEQSHQLIAKIQAYIHSHLHEELSLTRLGEYVHLNPSYLSRIYKRETGCGLLEYITQVRVEKAKLLLRLTSMKIHKIVSEVGFESGPYFTRLFKRYTGLTPQEYRDQVVKNK